MPIPASSKEDEASHQKASMTAAHIFAPGMWHHVMYNKQQLVRPGR